MRAIRPRCFRLAVGVNRSVGRAGPSRLSGRVYARAGSASATINLIDANGVGAAIGTVTFKDAEKGLLIIPLSLVSLLALTASTSTTRGHASQASKAAKRWRARPPAGITIRSTPVSTSGRITQGAHGRPARVGGGLRRQGDATGLGTASHSQRRSGPLNHDPCGRGQLF